MTQSTLVLEVDRLTGTAFFQHDSRIPVTLLARNDVDKLISVKRAGGVRWSIAQNKAVYAVKWVEVFQIVSCELRNNTTEEITVVEKPLLRWGAKARSMYPEYSGEEDGA